MRHPLGWLWIGQACERICQTFVLMTFSAELPGAWWCPGRCRGVAPASLNSGDGSALGLVRLHSLPHQPPLACVGGRSGGAAGCRGLSRSGPWFFQVYGRLPFAWPSCRVALRTSPRPFALPPRQSPSFRQQLQGDGLATVLRTDDFGRWEAVVASTLGHHRSERLQAGEPFEAHVRLGQVGGIGVLHLNGRGRLRLIREQQGPSVLWLPLRGMTAERINGQSWLAEPETALLFQPGDAMDGETSEQLEGLSILIPAELHQPSPSLSSPLLAVGPLQQAILTSARQLALAVARQPAGAEHAADQFIEALRAWMDWLQPPLQRERITARRRRDTVLQARDWMAARLDRRFGVEEISGALQVSTRQLQYSFLQEVGRSPMAEAKRLRLQQLRRLLLDREQDQRSIAELMQACGLIASGVTSADYRRWCGESPRRTRLRR